MPAAPDEDLRDRDRLVGLMALVLGLAVLGLAFFVLVRAVAVLLERRRAGFSGAVSGASAVAVIAGPRPSPEFLASWDRRSE